MGADKQRVTVEQVRRALEFLGYPFTAIDPMLPPYPDVRVTTPSGRIAVMADTAPSPAAQRRAVRWTSEVATE
jgi:hypothetical protein